MPPKGGGKRKPAAEDEQGTLADASERAVDALLKKRRKGKEAATAIVPGLPRPKPTADTTAACGAPAASTHPQKPSESSPLEPEEDSQEDLVDEWEDCDDDDGPFNNRQQQQQQQPENDTQIAITIENPNSTKKSPASGSAKPRRYTKRDKAIAQLTHRSHLLCLLARGLLFDAAADDLTLQGLIMSLVPLDVSNQLSSSQGVQLSGLTGLVDWFNTSFSILQQPTSTALGRKTSSSARDIDEIDAAIRAAKGVQGIIEQLTERLASRSGTQEQLSALFASLLRGFGAACRTVRRLEPSPLWPGDVVRQEENAMKAFAKKTNHRSGGVLAADQDNEEGDAKKTNKSKSKSGGKRKKKDAADDTNTQPNKLQEDDDVEDLTKEDDDVDNSSKNKKKPSRRKGDEELEREIAIAMAATGFVQPRSNSTDIGQAQAMKDGASGGAFLKRNASTAGGSFNNGAVFGNAVSEAGRYWTEVYCGTAEDGRWIHVDPSLGWIDRAGDVEALSAGGLPLTYAVAFAGGGGAKDVTRRYAASMMAAEKIRDGEWWEQTLRPLRSAEVAAVALTRTTAGGGSSVQHPDQVQKQQQMPSPHNRKPPKSPASNKKSQFILVAAREDRELEAVAAQQRRGLPTTVDGFRSHPDFILTRHIGRHQALRPDSKPVGLHRGEAYYQRTDVTEVHSAERWRRLGRQVLPDELDKPAKQLKKRAAAGKGNKTSPGYFGRRGGSQDDGDDNDLAEEFGKGAAGEEAAAMTNFYGDWQTQEWAPPAAVGGVVPKNERGNVEVPPFASSLPAGTIHVNLPSLGPLCKRLGIDFAPALSGFDIRAGRSVPRIEGVVICQEFEDLVREAHEQDRKHKEEQAQAQREAAAEANWRNLLRAILTRVRLGSAADGGAQAEAAAAMLHENLAGVGVVEDRDGIVDLTMEEEGGGVQQRQQEETIEGMDVEEI